MKKLLLSFALMLGIIGAYSSTSHANPWGYQLPYTPGFFYSHQGNVGQQCFGVQFNPQFGGCFQNCYQPQWVQVPSYRQGYVCNWNGCFLTTQFYPWWTYQLVNVSIPVPCPMTGGFPFPY